MCAYFVWEEALGAGNCSERAALLLDKLLFGVFHDFWDVDSLQRWVARGQFPGEALGMLAYNPAHCFKDIDLL